MECKPGDQITVTRDGQEPRKGIVTGVNGLWIQVQWEVLHDYPPELQKTRSLTLQALTQAVQDKPDETVTKTLQEALTLISVYHTREQNTQEEQEVVSKSCKAGIRIFPWEVRLAHLVRSLVGGIRFYIEKEDTNSKPTEGKRVVRQTIIYFAGLEQEVTLAIDLYSSLRSILSHHARIEYGGPFRGPGAEYCLSIVKFLRSTLRVFQANLPEPLAKVLTTKEEQAQQLLPSETRKKSDLEQSVLNYLKPRREYSTRQIVVALGKEPIPRYSNPVLTVLHRLADQGILKRLDTEDTRGYSWIRIKS